MFNSTSFVGQGSGIRVILACRTLTIGNGMVMTPLRFARKIPTSFLAKVIVVGVFLQLGSRESPKGSEGEAKNLEIWCLPSGLLPKLSHAKLQVFLS